VLSGNILMVYIQQQFRGMKACKKTKQDKRRGGEIPGHRGRYTVPCDKEHRSFDSLAVSTVAIPRSSRYISPRPTGPEQQRPRLSRRDSRPGSAVCNVVVEAQGTAYGGCNYRFWRSGACREWLRVCAEVATPHYFHGAASGVTKHCRLSFTVPSPRVYSAL
jgi:hypothetical protein